MWLINWVTAYLTQVEWCVMLFLCSGNYYVHYYNYLQTSALVSGIVFNLCVCHSMSIITFLSLERLGWKKLQTHLPISTFPSSFIPIVCDDEVSCVWLSLSPLHAAGRAHQRSGDLQHCLHQHVHPRDDPKADCFWLLWVPEEPV